MLTARDYLATEPGRIRNALVSLDFVLAAETERSLHCRIDQQTDFVIGELEHAIARIRRARTAMQAEQVLAAPMPAERKEAA